MKKLERVGQVCVDTGKLLIADPDYVESLWKGGTEPPGHPLYALTPSGKKRFPNAPAPQTFPFPWGNGKFDAKSPQHGGLSVNEMREQGLMQDVPRDPTGEFSLNGACLAVDTTVTGQLTGDSGAPLGFVTNTGYGDGVYPVFVRRNKDGRVAELVIKFMEG
jgi:hypothetical protein